MPRTDYLCPDCARWKLWETKRFYRCFCGFKVRKRALHPSYIHLPKE